MPLSALEETPGEKIPLLHSLFAPPPPHFALGHLPKGHLPP